MRLHPSRSAIRTEYLAVGLVAAIALIACSAFGVWAMREREQMLQDRGYRTTASLANVLEEQVVGAVHAVDLTLLHILDATRLVDELPEHAPDFEESMRQKLPRLPNVRALFIIGPDGFITQDTDHPFTPRANLADRGYFRAHIENPALGLYIGSPLLSRSTGTWFVSVSRRINLPDGGFGGIVVAAIEVHRFASLYRGLELGPSASIALFRRDGTLLLRMPHIESLVGRNMSDRALFTTHLASQPIGSYRAASAFDGLPRIISYRSLDEYPLVVSISIAEETVLAPWRRNVTAVAAGGLALIGLLAGVAFAALRYRRRYENARERRLQTQHLETLGHMTGGIAHDINNLLAIIASGTRVLGRAGGADAESSRLIVSEISAAVARGRALMTQLLSFAKSQTLDIQPVRIDSKVSMLEPLLRQAAGSGVTVGFDLARDLWACRTDPVQLDAALLNLAVNARDAMPKGGRLTIAARNLDLRSVAADFHVPVGEYVEIRVADDGVGMTRDVLRKAIEPFFSTKGEAGTGLGLSQVYGFVRQVGGDLRIESEPGKGTSVYMLFPRAEDPVPTRCHEGGEPADGASKVRAADPEPVRGAAIEPAMEQPRAVPRQ